MKYVELWWDNAVIDDASSGIEDVIKCNDTDLRKPNSIKCIHFKFDHPKKYDCFV